MLTDPGRRVVRLLAVALVAGGLLAGCTGGAEREASGSGPATDSTAATSTAAPSPSAPTVADAYRDARTAALSAESGHAVGTVTRDGTRLRIDLEGQANGSNQTVFIATPKGGVAEVLTVGTDYWVGGDEAHWADVTGNRRAAKALVGKYAPVTRSDATELGAFTLRSILIDAFAQPDLAALESDTGAATETEVDGRPAYVLGARGGTRLWVAADGSSTVLRYVGPKSAPADLTFSDWGRATTFTQPPPDRVVEN
ncbi:MAG: hypothetical protein ACJ72B_14390 [Ornithinibacter sp.]